MSKDDVIAAYSDFTKWCRDNPRLDLDSRLHTHGGPIGDGGYISDEKTRVAFAAWRAAIEADRQLAGDLEAQLEKALAERDDYHDMADQLAEQIAAITDQEIGEHSSGNNPWQNAMLAADEWIAKDIRRLTEGVDRKLRGVNSTHTLGEPATCFKCGHPQHRGDCVNVAPQAAAPVGAVPPGWRLVPIKPTRAMLGASVAASEEPGSDYDTIYRAMLATAPTPPAAPQLGSMTSPHASAGGPGQPIPMPASAAVPQEAPSDAEIVDIAVAEQLVCRDHGDIVSAWREDADIRPHVLAFARAILTRYGGQPAASVEPVAYLIDWPDEPELGHYIAEAPTDAGRCRALVLRDAAPVAAQPQPALVGALRQLVAAGNRMDDERETVRDGVVRVGVAYWAKFLDAIVRAQEALAAQPPAPAQQPVSGADGLPKKGWQDGDDSNLPSRIDSQPSGNAGELPDSLIPAEPDLDYLRSMAAGNALPAMLRGEIKAAVRWIEVTKPSGQAQQNDKPDMYWDAGDPERFAATDLHGAIEYMMDDYADSDMPMDLEFQCAQSMPNVYVRVTARSDADGYTYEVLDAARQEQLP